MTENEKQEDDYFNRKRYINGKFYNNENFDYTGVGIYEFAFFYGTMFEFEALLLKYKYEVETYTLKWEYLTKAEIELRELPIPNFRNSNTITAEDKRYLRSGYNTNTGGKLKSY